MMPQEGWDANMKRQLAIFAGVFVVIVLLGLSYSSRVIADLTVLYPTAVDLSGAKIVLRPGTITSSQMPYHLVVEDAGRVVSKRLEQLNLRGYYQVTIEDNQLEVTVPPTENINQLISIISQKGQVEFINGGTQMPPVGQKVATETSPAVVDGGLYPVLFVGAEINTVIPPDADSGEIFYQIELKPQAAERFSRFVENHTGAYICLVIDQQVINCSTMYHWANNTLDILPNLSSGTGLSLSDLAIFLNSGPLPVSLHVVIN